MFKLIGTITSAICTITDDTVAAILPLTRSARYASEALEINAKDLKLDAQCGSDEKAIVRATRLAKIKAEQALLLAE